MIFSIPDSAKKLFPGVIFSGNPQKNKVYLTFDDGPVPEVTPQVLDILKEHQVLATFFEVGENVQRNPDLHARIQEEGHQVANHTFNHLNGWKTRTEKYVENVELAKEQIDSRFFRPPYGRMTPKQFSLLKNGGYKVVYWNVLSKDYDRSLSPERCLKNVMERIKNGSVILFHDSIKAKNNVLTVLPKVLEEAKSRGFEFGTIDEI